MRFPATLLALVSTAASAEVPLHLQGLPNGIVQRGPAPAALAAVGESGRTRLWLPGGERTFEVERVATGRGATTRFGHIPGWGRAVVTLGPDGGFARMTHGGTVWLVEYRGAEAFAVRAGDGGVPFAAYDDGALEPPGTAFKGAPGGSSSGTAPARTVDFAGLYDADFAARYPGALAETRIAHFVALANQALVDSNVAVTLRMVHTQLAAGTVAPSALDNIGALYQAQSGGNFAGVDIRALRRHTGADVISFFRVHDLYAREVCGVAFFPYDVRRGFNVVMDGESGGSICDTYTFAHEFGHNLGARHQQAADSTTATGHAFVRPGQFTTIMASLGTGKPDRHRTLGYFSNPRIACGNLSCGTEGSEDNAGAMNANAERVSRYVFAPIPGDADRPGPTLADSDGDGAIDRIDAFPFDAARGADRDGDGHADPDDAFPDNSTEWVDSDGGGQGDNADTDDDNDGVADGSDRFRLDPLEWADADLDGWGDTGDAFDADPREQRDSDGDGVGDRADLDDDGDALDDVAGLAGAADGELLVADAATDRILRFRGSDFAPLGALVQLAPGEVTFRSGMAASPTGELYFVAGSQLRVLDRLRSTMPELVLDPASHPSVGTGFPLSPVLLASGDVMIGEMGGGALLTLRPAPSRAAVPRLAKLAIGGNSAPHICVDGTGQVLRLDGAFGDLVVYTFAGDPITSTPTVVASFPGAIPELASGDIACGTGGLLYWVDRRDGAVRSVKATDGSAGTFAIDAADAAAIALGPDGVLYVAQRSGGVRAYDAGTAADLGLVVAAADAGEPVALAWAPRILDASLPPIVPPTPPAPTADPATTPAFDAVRPPPPPCTTDCAVEFGSAGGGAFLAVLVMLLALLARIARPILLRP